jgi:ADP-ribosyl-[dinitrogen reductase] hydrolase
MRIDFVEVGYGLGSVGLTFCPGKKQRRSISGEWDRDLETDVASMASAGSAAVVTLVEPEELTRLSVPDLGEAVVRQHMDWVHLPIRDVGVPCDRFEEQWREVGPRLHARLRDGFSVVVHCRGGLGRAGMIAARLLIELGVPPPEAIARVRAARPGAIETVAQESNVLQQAEAIEPLPATEGARDRALGALIGLAVGDAVGTTLEFSSRDSRPRHTDMTGGGPFRLEPGQWTDDTAMALALADSLLTHNGVDEADLMRRFVSWRDTGEYSCTGTCFDIGVTVSHALRHWKRTGDPVAGSPDPQSAGNGALMRLAPVALRFWNDPQKLREAATRQSHTTHGAAEALSASVAYAELLADAISGVPRSQVLAPKHGAYAGQISPIMGGSWRGKPRHQIASTGYVAHSLEAALWSVGRTADFRGAILTAANLCGDADTTAAITGQLAGALYGLKGIPAEWLNRLAWRDRIEAVASDLFMASLRDA